MPPVLADPGPTLPTDVTEHAVIPGLIESPWLWHGFLLAALLAGYLLFRPERMRRRKTPRSSPASRSIVVLTLLALTGATWVNTYVGYVRTPHDLAVLMQRGAGWATDVGSALAAVTRPDDDDKQARAQLDHATTSGSTTSSPASVSPLRVDKVNLPDPSRGVPAGPTNVMLPPGYDSPANKNTRYPVVYLLHGYPGGSADDWFTSGDALATMQQLIDHQLVPPMIVVTPDVSAGQPAIDWECLNVPDGPQLEDYLTGTVLPQVDARYRTVADRQHRALGGMSGGGYCALNVGLKHLDLYSTLLVSLPYDDPGEASGLLASHSGLLRANTPRYYIPTMVFTLPVAVMLDAGANAITDIGTSKRIGNALTARGQKVFTRLEPGLNHTWRTARAALPYMFAYAAEQFPR